MKDHQSSEERFVPSTSFWSHDRNGKWFNGAGNEVPSCPIQGPHCPAAPEIIAAEAWKEYAAQGHGNQSLTRLNERGGFSWPELAMLLYERIKRIETWQSR